jgi:hypothetical protein
MIREVIRKAVLPAKAAESVSPELDQGQGEVALATPRVMVEMRGLEPLTPSLQRRCSPS